MTWLEQTQITRIGQAHRTPTALDIDQMSPPNLFSDEQIEIQLSVCCPCHQNFTGAGKHREVMEQLQIWRQKHLTHLEPTKLDRRAGRLVRRLRNIGTYFTGDEPDLGPLTVEELESGHALIAFVIKIFTELDDRRRGLDGKEPE